MPGIKILVRTKGPVLDKVEMTSRGPVFDGSAAKIIKTQMTATKHALGEELVHRVQLLTDKFFVNPTGYYRSQVDYLINQGNGAVIIHDRGVVYGPWLEGTGSRNRTSRFKGYHIFRQVTQQTQADVERVAAKEISVMVKQLNP
jgi:hypothetical protein